jgi:hypothetical protein
MPVIWQRARYLILPPLSRQSVFDLVRPQHLLDVWAITSLLVFVFVPRWTDSATAHVWASLIYAGAAPLIYGGIAGGLALGVSARAGRDTFIMRVPVRVVFARRGCDHARVWDGNLKRRFLSTFGQCRYAVPGFFQFRMFTPDLRFCSAIVVADNLT